ncbi:MAG: ribosomal protein L7/L12 [Candidatus Aminicenantes bacterium]|nr:ribosomal protein L7/L12 [Candidatus Aminicenantes bacterium]MCK5221289.1 ribosomal protein L7/L12 [Candidatus Aminicenantes bacterium]
MADQLSREQIEKIEEELFAENKIEAIKICRDYTGWGLKESKNFVERHIKGLIEKDSEKYGHLLSTGGRGCSSVAVFLIGLSIGIFSWIM